MHCNSIDTIFIIIKILKSSNFDISQPRDKINQCGMNECVEWKQSLSSSMSHIHTTVELINLANQVFLKCLPKEFMSSLEDHKTIVENVIKIPEELKIERGKYILWP